MKRAILLLLIAILFSPIIGISTPVGANPDGENWLSGYDYRKQITIDGSTAGVQTYYQMRLTVHKDYPAIASNGISQPIYTGLYPRAYYYNGNTYVVWQGGENSDPYIDCYNHATRAWHGAVKVGTNPLTDDDHGAPAVIVDNSGYIHVFYGTHADTPLKYAKSTNPEDISAWTAQSDIGDWVSYPQIVKDSSGVIHLFMR